jgi:hypothetical protein
MATVALRSASDFGATGIAANSLARDLPCSLRFLICSPTRQQLPR